MKQEFTTICIHSQRSMTRCGQILIDWLIEVHNKFDLTNETLYLTINIVDRFLAAETIARRELQCVGMSAMLIASKYEEIWAPEVNDFVQISDRAYEHRHVLVMEKRILGRLEWNITVPTPYVFLARFIKAANTPMGTADDTNLLTACGDHSIKVWDVQAKKSIAILTRHTGSVKSISAQLSNNDVIVSGSRDGSVALWDLRGYQRENASTFDGSAVDKPQADPIKLEGHEGEVTAVDWSSHEIGKIATSADDYVVQLWSINSSCYSDTRSSSSIRRRETFPRMQLRKLFTEEEPKESIKEDQLEPPIEPSVQIDSPTPASPEMRTPQSIRKQSPNSNILQTCERSPDSTFAAFGSPSSVLNPPPSLKRKTILDYFVTPST